MSTRCRGAGGAALDGDPRHDLHRIDGGRLPRSAASVDDDLAYTLLSYTPLPSRQMLRFGRSMVRRTRPAERERLARLLIGVLEQHGRRTPEPHRGYRPVRFVATPGLRTSAWHGVYGADLVLVILLLRGAVTSGELFPSRNKHADVWHRHVLLWRSAFDEQQRTRLRAVRLPPVHPERAGQRAGDRAANRRRGAAEPVDMNWLYRYLRGNDGSGWPRTYWPELQHKLDVSDGTNDGAVRHTMDPIYSWPGPAVTTFLLSPGGLATSLSHDVLQLVLGGANLPPGEADACASGCWAASTVSRPRCGTAYGGCSPRARGRRPVRRLPREGTRRAGAGARRATPGARRRTG
ncbi:hypothetical protein [Streptomyces halstedii]|uniref:Uncharacterized protein n=1 Tax=Streptomyces halstedii TaxID=1944 RepID=A0A6N9TUH6_STRHA|nr:hypothetical protein [Streptomyces halstedii]NEA14229.1 hypothetical protein [Streptomyces halstedii]